MASRLGSISSPYIIFLQSSFSWLPFTIFGVISLLASFTSCFFPETRGHKLTQTIEEAEEFFAGIKNRDRLLSVRNFATLTKVLFSCV